MSETSLAKTQPGEVEAPEITSLDQFIMRAASDPAFDVQKFSALLDLQNKHQAAVREREFHDSLSKIQTAIPQIDQNGLIDYGAGKGKISFAKLEDIDAVIKPIYTGEGFSVSFDSKPTVDGKMIEVTGLFSAHGHKETRSITIPPDNSGGKNGTQGIASSLAYAKRHLLKMFFNIVERGKDMDGAKLKDLAPITEEQALDVLSALTETGSDVARFLKTFKIAKVAELNAGQMTEVWALIDRKRAAK